MQSTHKETAMSAALSESPAAAQLRQQLRARLLQAKRAHASTLGADLQHDDGVHLPNYSDTTDDDAAVQTLNDAARAQVLHEQLSLAEIDAALKHLEQPDFDCCVECGEPIGQARLLAQPTALRCIGCQSGVESRSAQPNP
jgi:RNA polymerase-binding transcription factor DksA